MDERVDGTDRISELPAFIVHQILSHLPAKKAAQTDILSKRWNELRASFPNFDFDQTYFLTQDEMRILAYGENITFQFRERLKEFMEFVDASLLKFCMHKLRLFITILDAEESSPSIEKWIRLAIKKEVKEIDFKVLTDDVQVYTLPQTIFSAKSVTNLYLVACKIEQNSDTIRLNCLRELSPENVWINDKMVGKLSSECPLLEDLSLNRCWGMKHFRVSKALKLKILYLLSESDEIHSVEIVAPSLETLGLQSCPTRINFDGWTQLKALELIIMDFTDQKLHNIILKSPMLEVLMLRFCSVIERITVSSNELKQLEVSGCDNLKALELDTPNLIYFSYVHNPIPTISTINASCPWEVFFTFNFDNQLCLNLMKFLGQSNQTEVLTIDAKPNISSFDFEEFRKNCPSLPCNVEKLALNAEVPTSEFRNLLDGFLRFCYPKNLSLKTSDPPPPTTRNILMEWLYNELKKNKDDDVNCCDSEHIKCWRHYLKDIRIKCFHRAEGFSWKPYDLHNLMELYNIDNLIDLWPVVSTGYMDFHLDWCLSYTT